MRLAALSPCLLLFVTALPSLGRTILVRPAGDGDAPNLQGAVAAASQGDTILLANGTYVGEGNRDLRIGPIGVLIRSATGDPDSCIIDCESLGRGFWFDSGSLGEPRPHIDSRLEGVTVLNGRAPTGGAIECGPHSGPVIRNCVLRGNWADERGGAVHCEMTDRPIFYRCIIAGNSAGTSGGGIALCCCADAAFENCTLVDNIAPEGSAIAGGLSGTSVSHSIIAFHRHGTTIQCGAPCSMLATHCNVYGNADDVVDCIGFKQGANGNVSIDPGFRDLEGRDFRLLPDSPMRPKAYGSPQGIGARVD
jgi:hypothetical protein